jgi:SAM-dependent methyltransferase
LFSAAKTAPNHGVVHPFDKKYGLDTGGYLGPEELVKGHPSDAHNHGYSAIAPSVFYEACRRWRPTLPAVAGRVEGYTFVDVGAGKGRAILLASELPFRKIIGVELSKDLARIAQGNIERWNGGRRSPAGARIRMIQGDALELAWPRTPLLVYMYNPFVCSLVAQLATKLASAARSGSSLVDVLYVNPTCSDALTGQGLFERLWAARIEMDEADKQADPYGTSSDLVSAYRLKPRP